jgi:hypothetical protein
MSTLTITVELVKNRVRFKTEPQYTQEAIVTVTNERGRKGVDTLLTSGYLSAGDFAGNSLYLNDMVSNALADMK